MWYGVSGGRHFDGSRANRGRTTTRDRLRVLFPALARRKVHAIGMVKHQRAYARFRVHHEAFGQLHADVFGLGQLPQPLLVFCVMSLRLRQAG